MGAVTSVHSQGSCGARWAITAVETIESVYLIKSNQLLDLSQWRGASVSVGSAAHILATITSKDECNASPFVARLGWC